LAKNLSIHAWYGLAPENGMALALRLLWTTEAFYLLLALLAVWALLRVWFGAADARRYGWPLMWLLLAGIVAALAVQGSQSDLRDPLALGSATAPWVYGPGLAVTLVGLALALLGLALAGLALLTLTAPQALARWSRRPDQGRAARYDYHRTTN
jgi:hypothetical protein